MSGPLRPGGRELLYRPGIRTPNYSQVKSSQVIEGTHFQLIPTSFAAPQSSVPCGVDTRDEAPGPRPHDYVLVLGNGVTELCLVQQLSGKEVEIVSHVLPQNIKKIIIINPGTEMGIRNPQIFIANIWLDRRLVALHYSASHTSIYIYTY